MVEEGDMLPQDFEVFGKDMLHKEVLLAGDLRKSFDQADEEDNSVCPKTPYIY